MQYYYNFKRTNSNQKSQPFGWLSIIVQWGTNKVNKFIYNYKKFIYLKICPISEILSRETISKSISLI
jgi:hypothetical protein